MDSFFTGIYIILHYILHSSLYNSAALNFISASLIFILNNHDLLQIYLYKSFLTMAADKLDRLIWKFRQIWSHGDRAHVSHDCEEGRTWATLSVDLDPWRYPTQCSPPSPNPPRPPTHPKPLPKPPGIAPHRPPPSPTPTVSLPIGIRENGVECTLLNH